MFQIWWGAIGTTSPILLSVHKCFASFSSNLFCSLFNSEILLNYVYSAIVLLQVLPPADLVVVLLDEKIREHNLLWLSAYKVTGYLRCHIGDTTWILINDPYIRGGGWFHHCYKYSITDEAIRHVCFLSASCDAAWNEAIWNPTLMLYVDKVKVGLF